MHFSFETYREKFSYWHSEETAEAMAPIFHTNIFLVSGHQPNPLLNRRSLMAPEIGKNAFPF